MEKTILKTTPATSVVGLTKTALITALYMVITIQLSVISFGVIQLRLSEMFNYLALYHKRYVVAVTAGVVLANFFSPTWFLDVPIGGTATLFVLLLCRALTKNIKREWLKIVITAVIFSCSMFTVAGQLTLLFNLPFFHTWLTVAFGELLSMTIGGIIIYFLRKRIDFTK